MIQQILQLPELKVSKPSDTRWLVHEKCVRAVRMSYEAIVTCLNSIYADSHDPVALGLCKTLSKHEFSNLLGTKHIRTTQWPC